MKRLFSDNAASELAAAIADTDTSIALVDASRFPEPGADEFFPITLYALDAGKEINHEIMHCTGRSGNTLTVLRGQEGTTARAWDAETPAELRFTSEAAEELAGGGMEITRITSNTTLAASKYYWVDTSARAISCTLPGSPSDYDTIVIADDAGVLFQNPITVLRNGNTILFEANDIELSLSNREYVFTYYNGTWNVFISALQRWPTPNQITLDGPSGGNEGDEILIFVAKWDAANTYTVTVSGGSYTITSDAISWTLPTVPKDESHYISVEETSVAGSTTATKEVMVFNIPTLADDSISVTDFSDNTINDGWSV